MTQIIITQSRKNYHCSTYVAGEKLHSRKDLTLVRGAVIPYIKTNDIAKIERQGRKSCI